MYIVVAGWYAFCVGMVAAYLTNTRSKAIALAQIVFAIHILVVLILLIGPFTDGITYAIYRLVLFGTLGLQLVYKGCPLTKLELSIRRSWDSHIPLHLSFVGYQVYALFGRMGTKPSAQFDRTIAWISLTFLLTSTLIAALYW
jgi:hypothetical protein